MLWDNSCLSPHLKKVIAPITMRSMLYCSCLCTKYILAPVFMQDMLLPLSLCRVWLLPVFAYSNCIKGRLFRCKDYFFNMLWIHFICEDIFQFSLDCVNIKNNFFLHLEFPLCRQRKLKVFLYVWSPLWFF